MAESRPQLPARDSATWRDWVAFLRAYKVVLESISQAMTQANMPTLIEYSVLYWLNNNESHRLRQTDLSKGVLVSKSRVTRLLNSMVENGWVLREKTALDKRVTYAVLTEGGKEAYLRATPVFAEAFYRHFTSQFEESDQGELARLFSRLAPTGEPARAAEPRAVVHS